MAKTWLSQIPWDMVVYQNASLCAAKNALHKPTSDGYDVTRALWEERHLQTMSLMEAVDLCRRCHRMAPFCFYNGNTFAAIARSLVSGPNASQYRLMAGDIASGVATSEDMGSFDRFSAKFAE
jgi:hypothetical protein